MPPREMSRPCSESRFSTTFCDQDDLRTTFALSLSAMYRNEVPLYGHLVQIVEDVNNKVIKDSMNTSSWHDEKDRLHLERHGAIRLGSADELFTMRRLLALIGLHPVGYYDLSVAGLPMHATAFHPLTQNSLKANPFRIFTTLLRPQLLEKDAREIAMALIKRRCIFSNDLLELINLAERQGGFTTEQGAAFVSESMNTFRWQPVATASFEEYERLRAEHPILADIACFSTAHINHLTPRTLDIDAAQEQMKARGLAVKSRIEGPPLRSIPILLRQTSFHALDEKVRFASTAISPVRMSLVDGFHKARFGEIEQRGAAVTPRGRRLYERSGHPVAAPELRRLGGFGIDYASAFTGLLICRHRSGY